MRRSAIFGWVRIHLSWVVAGLWLAGANGGAAAPQPGRILTSYALTSTHDLSYYDPRDWTLLGSTNGGVSWTTLDVKTNQFFLKRNQRRLFPIANKEPFNLYRLKINRINAELDDPTPEDWQAQLAELELIGPVVGVSNETEMGMLVTSSWSHPLIGPPENAFDNDVSTRWVDFGPTLASGCWIQCQYVPRANLSVLVTNISQLALRARLAATHDLLLEKGPHILAGLNGHAGKARTLSGYALTSANDIAQRDPSDWRLLGSDDNGRNWTVVDTRSGERFATRFERRIFALSRPAHFAAYRLEIDKIGSPAGLALQLGELEPIYAPPDDSSQYSLVVSAKTDNPPQESCDMAFDGDPKTKWLSFAMPTTNDPCWIQWQSVPVEEGLPIINRRRLDALLADQSSSRQLLSVLTSPTNTRTRVVTGYAITSAQDWPTRDPAAWRLMGSKNGGQSWDTLDTRANETFTNRVERHEYVLGKPAAYSLFRLQIDAVANPSQADGVQLAKIEPIYAGNQAGGAFSTLVRAAGDFGLREAGVKAFDNDAHTKWLDHSKNAIHGSWIQWSYSAGTDAANPGQRVFDLDRLEAESSSTQVPSLLPVNIIITGVLVRQDIQSNIISLVDETGFQRFHLDSSLARTKIGDWIRLEGPVRFGGDIPTVVNSRLEVLSSIPRAGTMSFGQHFADNQQFLLGTVAGTVAGMSQGKFTTAIRLLGDDGAAGMRVRMFDRKDASFVDLTGRRIEFRGVVAPVFDDLGRRVAGTIWVANPSDANLAPLTENEWSRGRFYSVAEVSGTNSHLPKFLKVRGPVLREEPDGSLVLGDGSSELMVRGKATGPLARGSMAQAAGFLDHEGTNAVLGFATIRPAGALPVIASSGRAKPVKVEQEQTITDIRLVNDTIRNSPQKKFSVKLRGVVTYIDLGLSTFYLQDGSNGIPVEGSLKAGLYPSLGQEGAYVELEGAVKDGSVNCSAPVKILGKGQIPAPLQHSWDYLMTGRDDGLWVQIEGVVTAFEKQRLTLTLAGGQINVWINQIDKEIQKRLLGSVVRVSGICAPVVNNRNQRLGLRLLVPSGEYVELVSAPPDNPFDLPVVPIGRVMQLNNGEGSLVGQLIKTKGTVIYKASDLVFLQDGDDGIRVLLRDESNVGIGDVVEAVGLPQPDGFSPQLAKAVLHKVGHVALPEPKAFDVSDLSQADSLIDMDATRGWLDATLVGVSADDSLRVLQFRIESSDKTFSAFLPSSGEGLASLEPGSRVRLMGVFKAKVSSAPDFGQVISSFEMYLNAPDDITVLARPPWWTLGHTLGLLGGLGLVLLLALAWAGQLHRKVAQRTRELSEEITERKRIQAEADKAHRDLVVAARQAGMAEVAIGVLHNVGNVLNSVNVSATIVVDRIRHLKVSGLAKSIQLLRQHETNLTHFLSHDDKGKRLMPYMEKLAGHLESEQAGALQELENLSRNVEHIKDIVTVQQNYATYAGLTEPLQMVDLVEDALRMNASSLERHDVHIVREFDEEPPKVNADKHKILQILVNIVRNAQQACQESGREDKKVVIRVANGDGTIKVSTTDNGVGIAPENVSRIFNHGFTTRKDGHGFGLHTSALAAKEMGGILRFSSPGPGRGATFTLELPVAH